MEVPTPHGPARVHLHPVADPVAWLVLGHGAGGSVSAPDLVAVTSTANEGGAGVALVEQPYRVAGRRSAAPAPKLDEAWAAVVGHLRTDVLDGRPLVAGGRSSGARVACRTVEATGAAGVLCLAFPLHPPQRRPGAERRTRQPELDAVRVPVLVVQGESDAFGMPEPGPGREVAVVRGTHALRSDLAGVCGAVRLWLAGIGAWRDGG